MQIQLIQMLGTQEWHGQVVGVWRARTLAGQVCHVLVAGVATKDQELGRELDAYMEDAGDLVVPVVEEDLANPDNEGRIVDVEPERPADPSPPEGIYFPTSPFDFQGWLQGKLSERGVQRSRGIPPEEQVPDDVGPHG